MAIEWRWPIRSKLAIRFSIDMVSHDRIKRQGYFKPEVIDRLRTEYTQSGFKLNLPFEDDLLIVVLTFGIFLDTFKLPNLN